MVEPSHHKHNPVHHPVNDNTASPQHPPSKRWQFAYWFIGIGSLIWLLLRSGTKPRRLAYPCQRVAAANSVGFLAYLAALLGSATFLRRLKAAFTPGRLALFLIGLLLTVTLQSSVTDPAAPAFAESFDLPGWTSPTAVSDVFVITNVPEPEYSLDGSTLPGGVSPDEALHDDGVDALVNLMEANGDHFYKTTGNPNGLFGSDDVIVIKINNQWGGRNGTNTDIVKGAIYRLVNHPDGFTGAVIVAENAQGANPDLMNEGTNNSQFENQSYQEVVNVFANQGYHVCTYVWDNIRTNFVNDYDTGSYDNGYVLDAADDRLSYPKFQVDCRGMNLHVSMRKGLWNGTSFDDTRLKMINLPVLKRHNCAWATIAVKNYLGFITTHDTIGRWSDVSEMHCWLLGPSDNGRTCTTESTEYGLIARQMARIRRADLNIVDAIWVNVWNNLGGGSQRQDVLLASRDPFAVDYYASDYILGPMIREKYGDASGYEQAMASTHGGWFRNIQMRNVARLRAEGVTDTINMDDSLSFDQERFQFNVYVTDAGAPLAPSLTLQAPNGGENWTIGTQEQIVWSSTGQVGNVRLEYSTDGFTTTHTIADSAENDGAYTWTIPNDPSTSVLVRVSSTLSDTISDTSDAVFTIAGPHAFEDSFKAVSRRNLEGGETITYTIVLYEEMSATLALTDTIPAPCTYVPGSADIEPDWKGTLQFPDSTHIHWSGVVTSMVPVTITFQAQVPVTTTTWTIVNRAWVSRDSADLVALTDISFLNGCCVYLPIILRH
jgi:uncharacterized repeat protein (TIGR01451 family)